MRLTDHGREVLDMSRGTEIDKKIFSVLTKRERERFGSYLWKVRGSVIKDLGIPEWQLNLSLHRAGVEEPKA